MEVLMSNDLQSLYKLMQSELAKELLRKITSGEASAADLNVARQLLKDNNIDAVPKAGDPLHNLVHTLPFTGDDEDGPYRN